YTSPDPLGLAPAPNPITYVTNPIRKIDPLGLTPYTPGVTPHVPEDIPTIGNLRDTELVLHEPGHDVLDPQTWDVQANSAWLAGIIQNRRPVYLASRVIPNNYVTARGEVSTF